MAEVILTNQQFVVNSLDDDFFWRILANVETELEGLAVTFILDEW